MAGTQGQGNLDRSRDEATLYFDCAGSIPSPSDPRATSYPPVSVVPNLASVAIIKAVGRN